MVRMKYLPPALGLAVFALLTPALPSPAHAQTQALTLPLWPHGTPEPPRTTDPETDTTKPTDTFISGHRVVRLTNVTIPTLTVYPPHGQNTGAAVLVFPGGGYVRLVTDGEGTDACHWLNSVGITCILVKYRVPQPPGDSGHYPADPDDLEDAQQAMRLTRTHATEWHVDPARIGVIGFSAGAHLAVVLSTHPGFQGASVPPSTIDARPNFQMILYPGWLNGPNGKVDASVAPTSQVPPTFLVMAENDYTAHVENALIYFQALKDAKVPAELHLFTQGGHGFGMRPTDLPISHWGSLAETWLHTIHILGVPGPVGMP